jgi:hypothetical protein
MKTNQLGFAVGIVLAVFALTSPRAYAVMGVGDTTVIVGDITDAWKWPRELAQWTVLIEKTTSQIQKADAMIELAGHPDRLIGEVLGSVSDVTQPAEQAVGLEKREDALNFGKALYGLGATSMRTFNDANHVTDEYQAFGENIKRDPKRYEQYAMQQALYERYKKAVDNEREVSRNEMKVQHDALDKLRTAKTQTEIEIFSAKIAASRQRQDLAHQMAVQAKNELDAFRGQAALELERKSEADREWAEHVIERMRARALASYHAQVNAGNVQ